MKSSAKSRLNELKVVITRPREQACSLAELVACSGGVPVLYPTIEIRALPLNARAGLAESVAAADWAIFISAHAVRHGLDHIHAAGADLGPTPVASIGGATTGALQKAGVRVRLECPSPPGSESLLATPEMQQVAGMNICIVRGRGGRELLGETLRKRGATVTYVECYERCRPQAPTAPLLEAVNSGAVIVTTSVNGLQNLLAMTSGREQDVILSATLVVAGERQRAEARRLGWRGEVAAARGAENTAVLEALLELRATVVGDD